MSRQEEITLQLERVYQLIDPCASSPFLKRLLREDAEKFFIEHAEIQVVAEAKDAR